MTNEETNASPWDVFINLLAVIALYASTWAMLELLFSFIEVAFPDPGDSRIDIGDSIRYGLAVLIIFFPAYGWSWREIEIDLAANPGKRRRWLRTCPIYLTLFLAGMMVLSDLSCAVYYFLTGDLTLRFVFKVAAIAMVGGSAFAFYLQALRREPGPFPRGARIIAYATCAIVTAVVAVGFAITGSPGQARIQRFDSQRVEDLAEIQRSIMNYWKHKRVLPPSLDALNDDLSQFTEPRDPESNHGYQYRATSSTSFELCAEFAKSDDNARATARRRAWEIRNGSASNWNHPAGHFCFARTIDPSRYSPDSESPETQ